MSRLDNDVFIKELEKMHFNSRTGGAKNVSVTMKRYDGRNKPGSLDESKTEYSVLVRATHGSNKIATVVPAKEVNNFTILYTTVLRSSIDNLERRAKKPEDDKKTPRQKKKIAPKIPDSATNSAKGTPTALKK